MTILVVGNAAHLDLILKADARPGDSGFGHLKKSSGIDGTWSEGGAAMTIALAIVRAGAAATLWHPLPADVPPEVGLNMLDEEGVETGSCPRYNGGPVRSVIVYGSDWRLGWSALPQEAAFIADPAGLADVTELVIAPVWGIWTDSALAWAAQHNIPATLVGFSDSRAVSFPWHRIIVDRNQAQELLPASANEWVITDGPHGARVLRAQQEIARIEAFKADVVDTTGAGDTFAGTLIGAQSCGIDLAEAGKMAARRAARVCEIWGSRPPKAHFEQAEGL